MAFKGKIIRNVRTGQQIRFVETRKDTEGKFLEMESTYAPFSKQPPLHYHPHQTEDFKLLRGEMTVRIDGTVTVLRSGDTLHIPANTSHAMWNHSREEAVVKWKVTPALYTEHFFEIAMGLSESPKANADGMPGILQIALLVNKFSNEFRLSRPPAFVQQILFGVLAVFAKILGQDFDAKKYID